jgi:hypothetical protein
VGAQLVDIDMAGTEVDTQPSQMRHFLHHRGDMQQRFGRNTPNVQAHATQRGIALDHYGFLAQVRRAKRGGVTARATAEDKYIALQIRAAGMGRSHCGCRRRHIRRRRSRRRRCRWRRLGCHVVGFKRQQHRAFCDFLANLDQHFLDHAGGRGRDIHRRLVGFKYADSVIDSHQIAHPDQHLDHRHGGSIANAWHLHFNNLTHGLSPQSVIRRKSANRAARC